MKVFSDKQINSIKRDLQIWLGDEAAKSFDSSKDKAKWFLVNQDALLTNDQFVKKYDIDALISVDMKPMESLYNRYPNFDKLTENQIKRFTNSTDISKEDLNRYYNMRKKQTEAVDKYNKERWAEIDKNRQEYERSKDESYFNTKLFNLPISNEYARKHYIQGHPNQAVVNEVAGKVAGVADFLPWPFSYGGPAIRSIQKWAADEDVLTPSTLADFGGASLGGLSKIPGVNEVVKGTTSKIANILTRSKNPTVKQIANVVNKKAIKEEQDMALKELSNMSKAGNIDKLSNKELIELFNATNDPVIKANIEQVYKARQAVESARLTQGTPIVANNNAAANLMADEVNRLDEALEIANNKATKNMADYEPVLKAKSGNIDFNQYGDVESIYKDVPLEIIAEQYSRQQKPTYLAKALGEGLLGVGRKTSGQSVAHRNWDEINYKPDYNEDKAVDEVIRMYSNDWSLNRTPSNYDNPLIKAAYDKWFNKAQYDWNILNKLEQ